MSDNLFDLKKEQFLECRSQNAFLDHYHKTHTMEQMSKLTEGTQNVSTAGRIVNLRIMGKILFAHLYDFSGKIQICIKKNVDQLHCEI